MARPGPVAIQPLIGPYMGRCFGFVSKFPIVGPIGNGPACTVKALKEPLAVGFSRCEPIVMVLVMTKTANAIVCCRDIEDKTAGLFVLVVLPMFAAHFGHRIPDSIFF